MGVHGPAVPRQDEAAIALDDVRLILDQKNASVHGWGALVLPPMRGPTRRSLVPAACAPALIARVPVQVKVSHPRSPTGPRVRAGRQCGAAEQTRQPGPDRIGPHPAIGPAGPGRVGARTRAMVAITSWAAIGHAYPPAGSAHGGANPKPSPRPGGFPAATPGGGSPKARVPTRPDSGQSGQPAPPRGRVRSQAPGTLQGGITPAASQNRQTHFRQARLAREETPAERRTAPTECGSNRQPPSADRHRNRQPAGRRRNPSAGKPRRVFRPGRCSRSSRIRRASGDTDPGGKFGRRGACRLEVKKGMIAVGEEGLRPSSSGDTQCLDPVAA